jgi:hypothetical protein
MTQKATALFADRHTAHAAVEQLAQAGFARDSISIAMSEETHEREFGSPNPLRSGVRRVRQAGVLGALVSSLGTFATGREPPIRGGGPLMGALLRCGTLIAALVGLGHDEHAARAVTSGLRNGAIVVAVHADADRSALAMQLLELAGGAALQAA